MEVDLDYQKPVGEQGKQLHILPKSMIRLEYFRFPRNATYFAVHPGFTLLKMSALIAQRAHAGALDASMLWNYAPNVYDYNSCLFNKDGEPKQGISTISVVV